MASPKNTVEGLIASMVEKMESPCWVWQGKEFGSDWGQACFDGVNSPPHRVVYEHFHGAIADGFQLRPTCRNKHCVNPEHMQLITIAESIHKYSKSPAGFNARKTECLRGHSLSGANLYIDPSNGNRQCRLCKAMRQRARRRARKENHLA